VSGVEITLNAGRPYVRSTVETSDAAPCMVEDIVRACHTKPINEGLSALNVPGLDRSTLETVLTYCAEQRCLADAVTCPGCRHNATRLGYKTFDDFLKAHRSLIASTTHVTLHGPGDQVRHVPSFEALQASWRGIERWYEARRVIRKLRHGVRSRPSRTEGDRPQPERAPPAIILVEPQLADNIGMVARAMANFGLDEMRLVNPRDQWPNERARIAASGATFIVDEAVAFETYQQALAPFQWVAATTARQRDLVKPVLTPEQAVAEMIARTARGQRCAIVFGRERNGLETAEIAAADAIVMAPVDPDFASLNIAQAVLLLAYEWMKAAGGGTLGRVTTYETPVAAGLDLRDKPVATKGDLDGLLSQLEGELDRVGFFKSAPKRPTFLQNLRTLFTRMQVTQQEIRTLRGIIKALGQGRGPRPPLP
jgi:tRNA/rRNA methyltransferase